MGQERQGGGKRNRGRGGAKGQGDTTTGKIRED